MSFTSSCKSLLDAPRHSFHNLQGTLPLVSTIESRTIRGHARPASTHAWGEPSSCASSRPVCGIRSGEECSACSETKHEEVLGILWGLPGDYRKIFCLAVATHPTTRVVKKLM